MLAHITSVFKGIQTDLRIADQTQRERERVCKIRIDWRNILDKYTICRDLDYKHVACFTVLSTFSFLIIPQWLFLKITLVVWHLVWQSEHMDKGVLAFTTINQRSLLSTGCVQAADEFIE